MKLQEFSNPTYNKSYESYEFVIILLHFFWGGGLVKTQVNTLLPIAEYI